MALCTITTCNAMYIGLSCSLGLVPNYVVLVLGNESGGPHHIQDRQTRDLYISLIMVLTLNIHQISN